MSEHLDPLDGIRGDSLLKCRANYSHLHILKEDRLVIAEREPAEGETVVVLVDGKAKLGTHPVADASKALGVVTGVVRRLA